MSKRIAVKIAGIFLAWFLWGQEIPLVGAADPDPDKVEFFEKRIRPVLVENCYKCHGNGNKKGKLQLDSRAGMLKGGETGPVLVPGQPDNSLLIKAIRYTDDQLRMPPKSKLPDANVADFITWVKSGAPWPENTAAKADLGDRSLGDQRPSGKGRFDLKARKKPWSLEPLKNQGIPVVKNKDWPRSSIDPFILAKLESAGLLPSSPADKRALIRRVTYDLIGLPPTAAEIDDFLRDESPDAFARVVDRLLASPHYGERWGRHWLDLVRYAETTGHEYDFELPEAYVYRDYVIRALNADVPYDQLVIEHIAGDLLWEPRRHPKDGFNESVLGTGFWFLGESAHSPVDIRADESDRIDNQIDVLGKTFLGLTVACARCHDHKFDPISTKDYYALMGYLESSRMQRAFIDPPERTANFRLKHLNDELQAQAAEMTAASLKRQVEKLSKSLSSGSVSAQDDLRTPWLALASSSLAPAQFEARRRNILEQFKALSAKAHEREKRDILFEDFRTPQDWFVTGMAFDPFPTRATRAVLSPEPNRPVKNVMGPGVAHSGQVSNQLQGTLRSKTFVIQKKKVLYRVAGRSAQINLIIDGYQRIRDPIYGGLTIPIDHGSQFEWRVQDVSMWLGQRAYIEIIDDGPGYVAVEKILFSDDGLPPAAPNQLIVRVLDDSHLKSPRGLARKYEELFLEIVEQWRTGSLHSTADRDDRIDLLNWMLGSDLLVKMDNGSAQPSQQNCEKWATLLYQIRKAEKELPAPRRAMAMADGTGLDEPVHIRGNHKILGETVPRRFLEVIAGDGQPQPAKGSGRLELAQLMIDSAKPLLARVMVNRIWQHHFGEGLVRSPDNFGLMGEPPTHPELLDFLAAEFIRNGWSIKQMHRFMLLSSTYQMASASPSRPSSRGKEEAIDPQNKLLHRMPIRRLEAECIRDAILAVSGRLDRKMYGPSVLPYLTSHMDGRGRPEMSGPLDGAGRRSIYVNVRRNFLTPMFLAFDFPIPFTTMGRRSVSNVPAQALTLMNNPLVVELSNHWAKRILAERDTTSSQRIKKMFETAFARPPSDTELADALHFLEEQSREYGRADDVRAWSDLCHVLLNVKEFIFY
jgi:hypothetical protein